MIFISTIFGILFNIPYYQSPFRVESPPHDSYNIMLPIKRELKPNACYKLTYDEADVYIFTPIKCPTEDK